MRLPQARPARPCGRAVGGPRGQKRRAASSHELVLALRTVHGASEWPDPDGLVFPALGGAFIDPHNLRGRTLKPAAEEAGVGWVGLLTLRHTCASMLLAEGRNAVQVQRWLGHHSAAFTLATYVHLLDGDLGEPLRIEDGLEEPSEGAVHSRSHPR